MGAVRRRQFLIASGTVSVAPLAGDQQAGRVHSVGILFSGAPVAPDPLRDAFRDALREFGWIEGENVVIEARLSGIVKSLARPGGNITGLTLISVQPVGKHLSLLKEAVPAATRFGFLTARTATGTPMARTLDLVTKAMECGCATALDG